MEARTYTFYAPCPVLDIEAMQTWLEDMSLEGYLLSDCSAVRNKFHFYKIEPLPTRYRLTPVSDKIEEWNLRPNEEFAAISAAYGWEHVCSSQWLHIFRAYDVDAREIHTDPAVQTQAIRQLGWRIIRTALVWLAMPLVYFFLIYALGGGRFWQSILIDSAGFQIDLAYLVLFAMVKTTVELAQLYPLYRSMKRGYAPIRRKEWKKKAPIHRAASRVYPVLLVILAIVVVSGRHAYRDQVDYQPLPRVGTELPFLCVADLAQECDVASAQRMEDVNYMRSWSHLLSPVNYDWAEIVEVIDDDGTEGLVSIQLFYHEPKYDWLAEALAQEYLARAEQTGTAMAQNLQTGADLAYFYRNEYDKPAAVLRYGNTVISVEFPRTDIDEPALKFEYWIAAMDGALSG